MTVPALFVFFPAAVDLHEPHAAFDEPPGHQTLFAEVRALLIIETVQFLDVLRFDRGVEGFRPRSASAGEFETLDARGKFGNLALPSGGLRRVSRSAVGVARGSLRRPFEAMMGRRVRSGPCQKMPGRNPAPRFASSPGGGRGVYMTTTGFDSQSRAVGHPTPTLGTIRLIPVLIQTAQANGFRL
jgi:hypothetical protein